MNALQQLPRPFFVLAPMDDVTDTVFRQIVADCAAPDLFFTEFVNVDGLQSPGRERLIGKVQFTDKEQPVIAQVWGKNPDNFRKTAAELVMMGFAGIDINMGCPQKVVTGNGCCSALINNRELAVAIIKAVQEGVAGRVPVSVKTRLGWSSIDYTWHELLLQQGLDMLSIHGRTRSEMSLVPAHWDAINDIRKLRDKVAPNTILVGNGDVLTRQQGRELAQEYKLDGIMIGRGVFQDPFVFAEHSPWESYGREQKISLYQKHVELFAKTWKQGDRRVAMLNKFCKIYINDFDGAKELREQLMAAGSTAELLGMLQAAHS
jgi:tRNA-dihydrouridine synthase